MKKTLVIFMVLCITYGCKKKNDAEVVKKELPRIAIA